MVPTEPDNTLAPGALQDQILKTIPEIRRIAKIDVIIPFNMDSSNIGIEQWEELASILDVNMNQYEGFVIIHGTDTMVYTASALSFSLRNIQKPVILTGSQRPLSFLRSDARNNLIDAIELATMNIPEVLIVFGQKIMRGNRTKKTSISNYDAFESPNYPLIGEIGIKINLYKKNILNIQDAYFLNKGFRPDIMVLNVYPSLNPDLLMPLLNSKCTAYIVRGFGAGHLPNTKPDWMPFVKEAVQKGKLVFIGSHAPHGAIDLDLYESGRKSKDLGAIGLDDMTIEAAYVKLMKIAAMTDNQQETIQYLKTDWAGEL